MKLVSKFNIGDVVRFAPEYYQFTVKHMEVGYNVQPSGDLLWRESSLTLVSHGPDNCPVDHDRISDDTDLFWVKERTDDGQMYESMGYEYCPRCGVKL